MTPLQIATLKIEYPRRRQIFDESISIMQKTNNPDVFFRRYNEVFDFVQWTFRLKKEGCPITTEKTEEQMNSELFSFYNFHCCRIANYISEHSPKSKRFDLLLRLKTSLKPALNKEDAFVEITQLMSKSLIP